MDSLPTGKLLDVEQPYDLRRFQELADLTLDDIYTSVIADEDGLARCFLKNDASRMQTVVEFNVRQFPNIVIYTPPAPRQAVCIEPNTCPTDAFNLHERGIESNVIALGAGASADFKVSIYTNDA
jgi:aldose 1-epimerase